MGRKVFINIFFEKKTMLAVYVSIITIFTVFLGIQSILLGKQFQETLCPDIVLNGAMDEDGVMRYKLYQDIGSVPDTLEGDLKGKVKVQPVIIRNLLTASNDLNRVEYRVYGMHDNDISELSRYLKKGKLPASGKNEILIGSYASRFYKAGVGDTLNLPVTLGKDNSSCEDGVYTVSGVLSDNVDFFKGAIILSKETWCNANSDIQDNAVFMYVADEKAYKAATEAINSLEDEAASSISVSNNYFGNSSAKKSFSQSLSVICVVSLIVIVLLFFFLMRGMSKKIGLLKALGLPEKSITRIFCGGLFIITVIAVAVSLVYEYSFVMYMNSKANEFYGFHVSEYSLNRYSIISVLALNLINMLAAAVTITWLGKKVSPRDAMLKS